MAYLLNVFSTETWDTFLENEATVTGFEPRRSQIAKERVEVGDIFLCYLTGLSRWCGALVVTSDAYDADDPIFDKPDPFTVRFWVKPLVLLKPEIAIPIKNPEIWDRLSLTRSHERGGSTWTGPFRHPMNPIDRADGDFLLSILLERGRERQLRP